MTVEVAERPETWTKYDDTRPAKKKEKDRGMSFYLGYAQCWCYLCGREHPWSQPCMAQERMLRERAS